MRFRLRLRYRKVRFSEGKVSSGYDLEVGTIWRWKKTAERGKSDQDDSALNYRISIMLV